MATRVVLYHSSQGHHLSRGSRTQVRAPNAAYLLAKKGLDWASSDEVSVLQMRIKSMVDKNIKLVYVIQVMLFRRILPCQRQTCYLWEFDPAKHQTLLELFGTTHEDIWKVLFKAGETPPPTTEDRGLSLKSQANSVSSFMLSRYNLYWYILRKESKPSYQFSGLD